MRALIERFNVMQSRLADLLKRRGVMLGAQGHDLRTHLTRLRLTVVAQVSPDEAAGLTRSIAQMERILVNQLDNALEFGTRAQVRVRSDLPVISVADDGPGLPEAELERIFEPFEVSGDARTQGPSGGRLRAELQFQVQ